MTETPDERADRLLHYGLSLAVGLRSGDDPAALRNSLWHLNDDELGDVAVLLAACVDVDVPLSDLLAWHGQDRDDRTPRAVVAPPPPCTCVHIDHAAVARFLAGDSVPLSRHERAEVARQLAGRGWTDRRIGERLGIGHNAVLRMRQRHGIATGWRAGRRAA